MELKPQIFCDVCKLRRNLKPGAQVGGRRITRSHRGRALEKRGPVISCFTKFQTKDKLQRGTYALGLFKVIVTVYFRIFQSAFWRCKSACLKKSVFFSLLMVTTWYSFSKSWYIFVVCVSHKTWCTNSQILFEVLHAWTVSELISLTKTGCLVLNWSSVLF